MCCAMSLVCPSIATNRTCLFWARNEPVNMPKTIESLAKSGVYAVIRFLYSEKNDEECRPQVLTSFMAVFGRTLQLQQRGSWSVFDGKCLISHHHPRGTWLPVIVISFRIWNGRRRTTFWHDELQTSVENWQSTGGWILWRGYWKVGTTLRKMSTSERWLYRVL